MCTYAQPPLDDPFVAGTPHLADTHDFATAADFSHLANLAGTADFATLAGFADVADAFDDPAKSADVANYDRLCCTSPHRSATS